MRELSKEDIAFLEAFERALKIRIDEMWKYSWSTVQLGIQRKIPFSNILATVISQAETFLGASVGIAVAHVVDDNRIDELLNPVLAQACENIKDVIKKNRIATRVAQQEKRTAPTSSPAAPAVAGTSGTSSDSAAAATPSSTPGAGENS